MSNESDFPDSQVWEVPASAFPTPWVGEPKELKGIETGPAMMQPPPMSLQEWLA